MIPIIDFLREGKIPFILDQEEAEKFSTPDTPLMKLTVYNIIIK